jgi:hypothetical protein
VLGAFGYRPPPWYIMFKPYTEPWASDPAAAQGPRLDAAIPRPGPANSERVMILRR